MRRWCLTGEGVTNLAADTLAASSTTAESLMGGVFRWGTHHSEDRSIDRSPIVRYENGFTFTLNCHLGKKQASKQVAWLLEYSDTLV